MNGLIIRYILGQVLRIEGILMAVPCLTALVYGESEGFAYLAVGLICFILGMVISWHKPEDSVFYLKEGCVATALSWILLSVFGALPFVLTGEIPSFTDAMFETVSGFTTTGASILDDVEALSHTSLIWRSFTHWIGGMGVLVFLLAVLPMNGGSHMNLMKAESPGPSVGKLVPKVRATARILYVIYFVMTVIEFILLLLAGMPAFEALATSFGTAGTGGFGIKADSMASYSVPVQWIVTIFMILFGVNFNAYYYIVYGKLRKAFGMEEVRWYFIIILAAIVFITFDILPVCNGAFDALTLSAFQVGSIITTTGFATTDFNFWPSASKTVMVLLMFIGACAGSTGGGIKVSRILILVKSLGRELQSYIHPRSVRKVKMEGAPVDHEVLRSVNVYIVTFLILFIASVFLVSLEGYDLVTNFTAVAATINNIGPGLELVGPAANFGFFNGLTKWVLIFDMLAGRLELFPVLILFHPTIWKDMNTRRKARKAKNAVQENRK